MVSFLSVLSLLVACGEKRQTETTPWGTSVDSETGRPLETEDSLSISLADIQSNGEMILLTTSGPETYYDYHGRGMGTQYLLCERFAQKLGVSLRVEMCKDSAEMMQRLNDGDGDIAAFPVKSQEATDKSWPIPLSAGIVRISWKRCARRLLSPFRQRVSPAEYIHQC